MRLIQLHCPGKATFELMKLILLSLAFVTILASCNNNTQEKITSPAGDAAAKDSTENFFPVTSFLRGEIASIKSRHVSPLKKTMQGEKTIDSVWVKEADYEKEFAAFLTPVIDTVNLLNKYTQRKFLDQSVNAFTFTYDPIGTLQNTDTLLHWDLYIDPESQKVTRVFIKKKKNTDETLLLTWQAGKWCKIVTVKDTGTNTAVTAEIKIDWSFE